MKAWLVPVVASLGAGVVLAQETNSVPAASLPSTSAAPAISAPAAPAPAVSMPAVAAPVEAAPTNDVAAASTNAPAKHKIVKKVKKAAPTILTHELLQPPVEATVKVQNLNVRTEPSVDGDVIAKLHKGDTVTLLEDLTIKAKKGENTNWARIHLPSNTPVWVSAHLISSNNTVVSPRINVRSGPGENFAILGHLEKGAAVKDLRKQKDWMEIEAPADASAFVSTAYLDRNGSATVAAAPEPKATAPVDATPLPPPTVDIVNVQPDTNGSVMPAVDVATQAPATAPEPTVAPAQAPAPAAEMPKDEILPKRIVNREGLLRKSLNIQAPADYELIDLNSGELIDYITPLKPELDLKPFINAKVIVTGEEAVDVRWKFIPLIKVETIDSL